ncbi:hypothetical protein ABI59_05530 [Acidobacteria bacterium Mor1]|nr:hypothetical protein ABI59_05530 [Acidobacteria bacterium Mor1]
MRRPLVIGNWKMHLGPRDAEALVRAVDEGRLSSNEAQAGVAPPYISIPAVSACLANSELLLCAQNMHQEEKGAFTGEVSAAMLTEAGVKMVLLGHSERRTLFGETDEQIGLKVAAAAARGLVPVLCIGETEEQRDRGETLEVVGRQLAAGLGDMPVSDGSELVVAYEPVWAIGTGRTATPEQVDEVHRAIRGMLTEHRGAVAAGGVRLLYGGSVKPGNARELFSLADVDGGLIGGASLEARSFLDILFAARTE